MGAYEKPGLEIRKNSSTPWEMLWQSDVEIIDNCIIKIPYHCYSPPTEQFLIIPPETNISIKAVYYPVWKDRSDEKLMVNTLYQIRLSPDFEAIKGLATSEVKQIHIKESSDKNKGFIEDLYLKNLTTYDLFVPWHMCIIDSNLMKEFLVLSKKHEQSDFSKLINMKSLDHKIESLKNKSILDKEEKNSFCTHKELIKSMVSDDFYSTGLLTLSFHANMNEGLGRVYDFDTYSNELDEYQELINMNIIANKKNKK